MKITKRQLRKIIKEAVKKSVLTESTAMGSLPNDADIAKMSVPDLEKAVKAVEQKYQMFMGIPGFEGEVERADKLAVKLRKVLEKKK